jgi:hypothetical protein
MPRAIPLAQLQPFALETPVLKRNCEQLSRRVGRRMSTPLCHAASSMNAKPQITNPGCGPSFLSPASEADPKVPRQKDKTLPQPVCHRMKVVDGGCHLNPFFHGVKKDMPIMQVRSPKTSVLPFTGSAPINTGFQPGAESPRQHPDRFPTVSRTAPAIQNGRGMVLFLLIEEARLIRPLYGLRAAHIQPLYGSRTGVEQVKTGPIQVNTGKYGPRGKTGPVWLESPGCLMNKHNPGRTPKSAMTIPHGHGPGTLSQLEMFALVCGCWSLKHLVFASRMIAKGFMERRKTKMRALMLLRGMHHNFLKQPAGRQSTCPICTPLLYYVRLSSRNGTNSRT